jgi:hypothetical protein
MPPWGVETPVELAGRRTTRTTSDRFMVGEPVTHTRGFAPKVMGTV